MLASKENLPNGTVVTCSLGTRTVQWDGNKCRLLGPDGREVNSRREGGSFLVTMYKVVSRPTTAGGWLNNLSNEDRKACAMARGLFAYFPDALAMVARHSVRSNEKHNPGQPVHWAREKSTDHEDCIGRHSLAVAVDPLSKDDGQYHIVCRAWRALAALQVWIEEQRAKGVSL